MLQTYGHSSAGYGLVFRHQDHGNCYRFTVTGQGEFELGREYKNRWRYFDQYQGKMLSPGIKKAGKWNHLKVVCQGNSLRAYVNGQQVAEVSDSTFRTGHVGLVVGTEESGQSVVVQFDNLAVDRQ